MAERAVWRPPWYLWPAIGLTSLLLIHRHMPWLLEGHWLFLIALMLVALVLVAAALWELPPAVMMSGAIVLTIFSGSWGSLGLPGFPFLPDRILLVGALLALLLRAPGASGLPRLRVRGVHLLLALTVLYGTASAAAAGTLGTKAGVFDLLDRLGAIPFLMLLVAPLIFSGPRTRNVLLTTLVGLGAYLGITAFFEAVGPHGLVFPRYIAEGDAGGPFGQAGGPFQTPITEGFACFACGVAAAIAFHQWQSRARRCLAGAVVVLSALGAFLSLERGVWIATGAGVLAVGLVAPELRRRLLPAVVVCGLLIGGALVASPMLAGHTTARTADQFPVWDRQNQTATALRMIAARPLFGFGWDNYRNVSIEYFRQASDYPMTGFSNSNRPLPLHDSYLSNAVELGLVGALLWLVSVGWGLGGAIFSRGSPGLRPWKLGLLAISAFYCVLAFFDPLQQNFTGLLLWTWAGLVLTDAPQLTPQLAGPSSAQPEECESQPALEQHIAGAEDIFRGQDGIRRWWREMHEAWSEWESETHQVRKAGDQVLVSCAVRAQGRQSGATIEAPLFQVTRIRAGMIVASRGLSDRDQALRAVGLI
jgi:putative inorganic carbon (hco3(-)) transporter